MCGSIGLFDTLATGTVAEQTTENMIASGSNVSGALVNVPGVTVNESCGDLRNSKVIDISHELERCGVDTFASDPQADSEEAMHGSGVRLFPLDDLPRVHAIVAAVAQRVFAALATEDLCKNMVKDRACIDVNEALSLRAIRGAGLRLWWA
jgi:UDP-N-acetyl-D-galactosamine dehydrogenase